MSSGLNLDAPFWAVHDPLRKSSGPKCCDAQHGVSKDMLGCSPRFEGTMRRREFITMLGGAAATWPIAARAQQQTMPVVGVLDSIGSAATLPAFRDGLAQMGYVAGRNVALDVRSTDNYDRLPELARDLASGPVAAIAALGGPSAPAAKAASATIPIVFTIGGDPDRIGPCCEHLAPRWQHHGCHLFHSAIAPEADRIGA